MKNLKLKLSNKERKIVAICQTSNGLEWSIYTENNEGQTNITNHKKDLEEAHSYDENILEFSSLPLDLKEILSDEILLTLPSKSMFIETTSFPTSDRSELTNMAQFYLDKKIPLPNDKMIFDNEIISDNLKESHVLLGAAQISKIDIYSSYKSKNYEIKCIDSRICGWLSLIPIPENMPDSSNQCLIIDDGLEVHLLMRSKKLIHWIRPLYLNFEEEDIGESLSYELKYSFQQYGIDIPENISIWRFDELPKETQENIQMHCTNKMEYFSLSDLPNLSQGIINRYLNSSKTINFLPSSWAQEQNQQAIYKKIRKYMLKLAAIWLVIFSFLALIYGIRNHQLNRVLTELEEIKPVATIAKENSEKLKALQYYTDRSTSPLECLRELTFMLPAGDIEFTSYNYSKSKGVTLRGTAINDDIVYEFFKKISQSSLFTELKNQSINTRTTKGIKRTLFSITLTLPEIKGNL